MIGYVVNYLDAAKRAKSPSGLLVTHPLTRQVIAVGVSPLSDLLVRRFADGFSLVEVGTFNEKRTLVAKPRDIESFEQVAPIWFRRARMTFVKIEIQAPLSGSVPVAQDLRAQYTGEPFEKILLTGARL